MPCFPRSMLNQMYQHGNLNYYKGINTNGSSYTEYMFLPQVKPSIVSKFKY